MYVYYIDATRNDKG